MSTSVRLLDDPACIEVRFFGDVTPADLNTAFEAVLALAREEDLWLILADTSELTSDPTVFALYDVAAQVADAGVARRFREAVVAPPGAASADSARFFEDAMVNRGLVARVFGDRVAAEAWLGEQARGLSA
jgi:hypothetical protein